MKTISKNNFTFSGRLTADAVTNEGKSYARFTLAHNLGKDNAPLFLDIVMFNKNRSHKVKIPFDLLKKGAPVIASGYMKPDSYTNKEGKEITKIQFIALSVKTATAEEADATDEQAAE